jgi:hypothetical protein
MEKKILYILIIILSAYTIYINISHRALQDKNNSCLALKEYVELEGLCKGKVVDNIKISNSEGQENRLYTILSAYNSEYFLVIISSIKTCSTCREKALNIWDNFYKKNKNVGIVIIITEEDQLSKKEKRQITASIKALNIEAPYYFDDESILFTSIDITPTQTPLALILSHDKKIIAVASTHAHAADRTTDFIKFFISLNSPGGVDL